MDWKNDMAEIAMIEAGKKIMEEAAKRKASEIKLVDKPVGKWTITLTGNDELTKEEIAEFIDKLILFSKEVDEHSPNLQVSIDPVIENN